MFVSRAVRWHSKKLDVVAQCATEAEYIALAFTVRESLWTKKVSRPIRIKKKALNIFIKEDNQGCISFSKDNIVNHRSKHIDINYQPTADNIAIDKMSV